ncbi:MAG TPA: AAA family ATPase [Polyangiaceae bacterium]|nr:AAA family ATPase [Polyangiaceae bacterium]
MRQGEGKQAEAAPSDPLEARASHPPDGGTSSSPPSSEPPGDWTSGPPTASELRSRLRVASELASVRMSSEALPEEPAESMGLLDLIGPIGRRALDLGLAAREPSFHVFVAAAPEVGIEDEIVRYAESFVHAHGAASTPPDLVYVHDFHHPEAPRPLVLPAGAGTQLAAAMEGCLETLREQIAKVGELEPVKEAQAELAKELETKNREVLTGLEVAARTLGFGVRAIQGGVQTFPILHGKPLSAEQFSALDESTKKALSQSEEHLAREVEKSATLVRETSERYQEAQTRALAVAARAVIREAMEPVFEEFTPLGAEVVAWLEQVQQALIEDWADFVRDDEDQEKESAGDVDPEHAVRLGRFRVNLFVTHEPGFPALVIYDTNPTYPHLFGYLERRARYGALLTDFTRIRSGSLQRASGGVLIVRAADVLADPIIWERLKRVLRERRIGAEDPLGPLGLYATSLRPVPVPVRVRVVLVGTQDLYAALLENDADFASLFRVKVEIEPSIPRTPQSLVGLDAYLMSKARAREWGRFDRGARARLLDLSTRLAGQKEKLSIGLSPLEETMAFASAIAAAKALAPGNKTRGDGPKDGAPTFRASVAPPEDSVVTAEDIDVAWRERRDRAGAAERAIREMSLRGEVALDTEGSRVGVVNGLSVFSAGDVEFGQPMRITAVVALGREGIIDVEREAQLGGAIHTKGVAIMRGYLGRMFGQERPLSLRAQLAIEQSYGEIDGDSASSSELFAVLSALAELPIDQGIAVTGSVNQLGEMQAIGGLCAKIEGFFDLCAARGLTGRQGVMLPRSNVQHLVLREDVAEAIAADRFHLYAVDNVASGIELLTGVPAGERDPSGHFPASSVFARVERRLIEIAERLREAESKQHTEGPSEAEMSSPELQDASDFRVR